MYNVALKAYFRHLDWFYTEKPIQNEKWEEEDWELFYGKLVEFIKDEQRLDEVVNTEQQITWAIPTDDKKPRAKKGGYKQRGEEQTKKESGLVAAYIELLAPGKVRAKNIRTFINNANVGARWTGSNTSNYMTAVMKEHKNIQQVGHGLYKHAGGQNGHTENN